MSRGFKDSERLYAKFCTQPYAQNVKNVYWSRSAFFSGRNTSWIWLIHIHNMIHSHLWHSWHDTCLCVITQMICACQAASSRRLRLGKDLPNNVTRITCIIESYDIYEWILSNTWMTHAPHINCQTILACSFADDCLVLAFDSESRRRG